MKLEKTVEELVKELRMVSDMINMGEKISWGRETTLMDEAANMLETLTSLPKGTATGTQLRRVLADSRVEVWQLMNIE